MGEQKGPLRSIPARLRILVRRFRLTGNAVAQIFHPRVIEMNPFVRNLRLRRTSDQNQLQPIFFRDSAGQKRRDSPSAAGHNPASLRKNCRISVLRRFRIDRNQPRQNALLVEEADLRLVGDIRRQDFQNALGAKFRRVHRREINRLGTKREIGRESRLQVERLDQSGKRSRLDPLTGPVDSEPSA